MVRRILEHSLAGGHDFSDLRHLASPDGLDYPNLLAILRRYHALGTEPLITSARTADLLELENRAAESSFPPLHSLIGYWVLDARQSPGQIESVLHDLTLLDQVVDVAYRELDVKPPASATPDYSALQGYVDLAPEGVDARWAWSQGFKGNGVRLFHLDMLWNLEHEDLNLANLIFTPQPPPNPPSGLLWNDNYYRATAPGKFSCGAHGTEVLGVLVGSQNGSGVDGIAPDVSQIGLVSHYKYVNGSDKDIKWDVASAIVAALLKMSFGDVLLLEVQTADDFPIEVSVHCFDAIRLATGNGRTVVEAAGNGGHNLDLGAWAAAWGPQDWPTNPVRASDALKRGSSTFQDSGAIMVGGCRSDMAPKPNDTTHGRWVGAYDSSNFGSRLDCYAWGQNVYTPGGNDINFGTSPLDPQACNRRYATDFDGTSAASAIIAGTAILTQEMYRSTHAGNSLAPAQLRAVLSDAGGTHQDPTETMAMPIGVMPNLRSIGSRLGTLPDVYVRDSVSDTGQLPNTLVYQSPDIFVLGTQMINAQNLYGEGSGTENQMIPNVPVSPNQTYHVHVRVRNRAAVPAPNMIAYVYWSEANSLVVPLDWRLIGKSQALNVPPGGILSVTDPIVWDTSNNNLPSVHGCFVAVLDQAQDPAPSLLLAANPVSKAATTWAEFLSYLGNNNNIAWRNFEVLSLANNMSSNAGFGLCGAFDRGRVFDLEILQSLPDGARCRLEIPVELMAALRPCGLLGFDVASGDDPSRVWLTPRSATTWILGVYLGRGVRYTCRLHVENREPFAAGEYRVAVRQVFEGLEVGRLTWALESAEKPQRR